MGTKGNARTVYNFYSACIVFLLTHIVYAAVDVDINI